MYRVLLVDDEALVREAISENMKWGELGYELIGTCKNGKEAVDFLKENKVDLIITDICMPYMDGLELAKHVFEDYPDSRVIIISGYNEFEYAKKAVKYRVVEYVLKPVTMSELSEVLLNVKQTLFEEKIRKDSLKKLEVAYIKNLPLLRTRYLNQIINGIHQEQLEDDIQDKLKELNIGVDGKYYTIAVIVVENSEEFLRLSPEAKKDLPPFIIFNIIEELVGKEDNTVVFQDLNNNTVVVLGDMSESEQIKRIKEIYEECKPLIEHNFGLGLTLAIGNKVKSLSKINKSYESALEALKFRFLYGANKILNITDLKVDENRNIDISESIKKLLVAIKINNKNDISTILNEIKENLRLNNMSQSRVYALFQNIMVAVNSLLDSVNLPKDGVKWKQEDILQKIYSGKTLEAVEIIMLNYCNHIGELLLEQREGFGNKQAILAEEYIEQNYMNSELSLQTICYELSISMSYFSTIFKTYTGETFIEALTKKRMNKAKELLTNTSMKNYEIADKVGYSDPHYFAITFKKYTGMTPKEYAKERRRNQ